VKAAGGVFLYHEVLTGFTSGWWVRLAAIFLALVVDHATLPGDAFS
jgi:hypothetical protein